MASDLWAGVDVGGRRKGFHAAVIQAQRLVELQNFRDASELATWLRELRPSLVAVDSPLSPAPDGERSRAGERALAAARICSIRYTPDRNGLASNPKYYEWIEQGFLLYRELRKAQLKAIECFPTASWTRWAGPARCRPQIGLDEIGACSSRNHRAWVDSQSGCARCDCRRADGGCPRSR